MVFDIRCSLAVLSLAIMACDPPPPKYRIFVPDTPEWPDDLDLYVGASLMSAVDPAKADAIDTTLSPDECRPKPKTTLQCFTARWNGVDVADFCFRDARTCTTVALMSDRILSETPKCEARKYQTLWCGYQLCSPVQTSCNWPLTRLQTQCLCEQVSAPFPN